MTSRYFSRTKQFIARAVGEKTISPPSDLSVSSSDWIDKQLFDYVGGEAGSYLPLGEFNPESNYVIKALGLYSNFADGLVFKNPSERIDIQLFASVYNDDSIPTPVSGAFTVTKGSKTITGVGSSFLTDFSAGDIFYIDNIYFIVDGVTNDTLMTAKNYSLVSGSGLSAIKVNISSSGNDVSTVLSLPTLNEMYPVEDFFLPVSYTDSTIFGRHVIFTVSVNNAKTKDTGSFFDLSHDIDFLTKSVNPSFADDTCFFDVLMELEYTPASI